MRRFWRTGIVAVGALAGAAVMVAAMRPAPWRDNAAALGEDWPRFGFDVAGSGSSPASTGIDAGNVASLTKTRVSIDGTVDAAAIYLHGVQIGGAAHDAFFVTTTYGKTIAIDAARGAVLWTYTPPNYSSWAGTRQITNATPVADPDRQSLYAATPDGNIQKLSLADGHALWSTAITRLAHREKIASSLNYYHGRVIATTGGYIGDAPPYQGHVSILDAASGKLLHTWNSLCSDSTSMIDPSTCAESGSAIWGRTGAVIDTATGNIYVATGNGHWDGKTNWGDATLRLDSTASTMLGNYTPENTQSLDETDTDVGSTSPALLGGGYIAQGGKDGTIKLIDTTLMSGASPHKGGELESVSTPSGARLFTALTVMHTSDGTWLFAADNGGTAAWTFRDNKLAPAWQNKNGGTTPLVAGGLLYVYDPHGGLRVYDPRSGRLITTLECGSGHWNSPIVVDGRIALPEGNANEHSASGVLDIWHR
ncbi:MAG TPA: PQQ-binding-like beta-propeller repeat protein [Gemmatimonadaceae bacterium]|nr:PQQ-binding-like beta-propeller repeat protein [Gemmatimonadaceae bacterium]